MSREKKGKAAEEGERPENYRKEVLKGAGEQAKQENMAGRIGRKTREQKHGQDRKRCEKTGREQAGKGKK